MVNINPNIPIITLYINGLNKPIKRQRLSECIKKQDPLYVVYEKPTLNIKNILVKSKWMKKDIQS